MTQVSTRRIAYLACEAPRRGRAAHTHIYEIVEGLRRRGYMVDLFVPRYSDLPSEPGMARRFREYARLQWRLFRAWRNYDLVYVRAHMMSLPTALLARLTRKPIIYEVNGPYLDVQVTYPWTRPIAGLLRWMWRTQYRLASTLIAVTPQLKNWLRVEGCKSPIEVVANGANLALFNPERPRRPGLPARYVVFFGVFARWQGIPVMIEAVRRPSWPADVFLVMMGSGQLESDVRAAAETNGPIVYLGNVPYEDVAAVVVGAIAGLVPKTREDDTSKTGLFPIKLFEILSSGTPAIVSDYPGQADLVRSAEAGIVIPPEDADALAQAVAHLAKDDGTRDAMGRRGHALIAREHSWDHRAAETARIIERTLEMGRSQAENITKLNATH